MDGADKYKILSHIGGGKSLVMHNDAARGVISWSPLQLDVCNIALSMIRPDHDHRNLYEIPLDAIPSLTGRNKNFTQITAGIDAIPKDIKKVTVGGDGQRIFESVNVIEYCRYEEGSDVVHIQFSENAQPLFFQLKEQFTKLNTIAALTLEREYAKKLYAYLSSHAFTGGTIEDLEHLKTMLVLPDSYRYTHVEERVLRPSIAEINEKTSLMVEYKPVKKGRKIARVRFVVKANAKKALDEAKPKRRRRRTSKESLEGSSATQQTSKKELKHPGQEKGKRCVVERMRERGLSDKEIAVVCQEMSFKEVTRALYEINLGIKEAKFPTGFARSKFPCLKN